MPESETSELEVALAVEQAFHLNTERFREAIEWWNSNYSRRAYRKKIADGLRKHRIGETKVPRRYGGRWHLEHRGAWSFLARAGDAMHTFPRDTTLWRQIGTRDAARILLVTAMITRPDFNGENEGLEEKTPWSNRNLLEGHREGCFGRDWADGSFVSWDDEGRDNAFWHKLAKAAWMVMQSAGVHVPPTSPLSPLISPQVSLEPTASHVQVSSPDKPVPFTDDQRQIFQRVANLVRLRPHDFMEAGKWLDSGADLPCIDDRVKRTRDHRLRAARSRRQIGRSKGREAGRAYLVSMQGPTLAASRTILARQIREVREKAANAPTRYDILRSAALGLLDYPPNYDADAGVKEARRVVLAAWLLTDKGDLHGMVRITRMEDWEWGTHPYEFLANWPDGDMRPLPRMYARTTLLDARLKEWMQVTQAALRCLDESPSMPEDLDTKGIRNGTAPAIHDSQGPLEVVVIAKFWLDLAGEYPFWASRQPGDQPRGPGPLWTHHFRTSNEAWEWFREAAKVLSEKVYALKPSDAALLLRIHHYRHPGASVAEDSRLEDVRSAMPIVHELLIHLKMATAPVSINGIKAGATDGTGSRKRGGRPRLDGAEENRRMALVEKWERAKAAGTARKDFCSDNGIRADRLDRLVNWYTQRQKRSGARI